LYFDKNMMTFGDIVKPLLKYVRFPLMSVMDFIENVVPTKILSAEDTSQVLETLRAIKAERYVLHDTRDIFLIRSRINIISRQLDNYLIIRLVISNN